MQYGSVIPDDVIRLTPELQGYLAHKKQPPPLGPPWWPMHSPTVGS